MDLMHYVVEQERIKSLHNLQIKIEEAKDYLGCIMSCLHSGGTQIDVGTLMRKGKADDFYLVPDANDTSTARSISEVNGYLAGMYYVIRKK